MEECHLLLTDQINLMNPEGNRVVHDISKPLPLGGPPDQGKELYITRHSAPSNRNAFKSHMRILSVVSLKTYSRYGYTFLKEIVLRKADYKEYKISEANFKNLNPNDFEDLYMLHLQGNLNHLSGADKVHLFNTFNLWIRNIVIRQRVEELQLDQQIRRIHQLDTTYRPFHSEQRIDLQSKQHICSSKQYGVLLTVAIFRIEPILNEARAKQNLTEPNVESNVKYELSEELLKELSCNTYSGRVEEDVVGHITKILEILDLIKIAGVDPFQLRMMAFPFSLSGDVKNGR
ncbi:hypothetical protein Tco_0474578 [Tanacetum coccineum]